MYLNHYKKIGAAIYNHILFSYWNLSNFAEDFLNRLDLILFIAED